MSHRLDDGKKRYVQPLHTIRTDSFTTHTPLYDQITKLPTIPPLKRIDYLRYIPVSYIELIGYILASMDSEVCLKTFTRTNDTSSTYLKINCTL